ncbi:uncharacterized protein METZ01_LOCUS463332, partial [marine metagenome]
VLQIAYQSLLKFQAVYSLPPSQLQNHYLHLQN